MVEILPPGESFMSSGPVLIDTELPLTASNALARNDASFPPPVNAESSFEDLAKAIDHQHERLRCLDPLDPDRLHVLYEESIVWYLKYRQRYISQDLDESIRACRSAVRMMKPDYEGKRTVYQRLCSLLQERYTVHDMTSDQEESVEYGKLALAELEQAPDMGSKRWWTLHNGVLGSLCPLIETFPSLIEWLLEEHVERLQVMENSHSLRARYLSRVCYILTIRREKGDLSEAISIGYKSLDALQFAKSHDSEYLTLGHALFVHYQIENMERSLLEALQQTALSLEEDLEIYHITSLLNLGSMLEAKCQRLISIDPAAALVEINEAVGIGDAILSKTNEDDYRLAYRLTMIAAWHTTQMALVGDVAIGDAAVPLLERALSLQVPGQAQYSHALSSLSHLRDVQYQILSSKKENQKAYQRLDMALVHARKSLDTTSENDPLLGERRLNLGKLLLRKYLITDDAVFDLEATTHFASTFHTINAPLQIRIQGAIQAGIDMLSAGDANKAMCIYDSALELLKTLNEYSISSQDLQQTLRFVSGLATMAASAALETNRSPYEVLMCLETGRCVISGVAISSRTDVSELRKLKPNLADQYDGLRKEYALASRDLEQRENYREAREHQTRIAKQLATIESTIRELPGWGTFQLALSESEVRDLAKDGPIVVVNVTQRRSDAIVITYKEILPLELPNMTHEKLLQYISLFDNMGNEARRNVKIRKKPRGNDTVTDALLWLWDVAVEPILKVTERTPSRRIWWLTTGLAGRAPFHAAGDHRPGSVNNTYHHVVSSYISSLKALRFARSRSSKDAPQRKMLLVTMSTNPSPHRDLDTSYEESAIQTTFSTATTHLPHPDPDAVLAQLPDFPFVHFACHGASIAYDPSQSGLLLSGRMLTISDLEKANVKHGAVAYLSACSTAEQADGKLADEAIHLANSFHALGFQHVVGTMWGAEDQAAGEVARTFYGTLFRDEDRKWSVAHALHEAVGQLMKQGGSVASWGPFIHIGA